MYGQLKEHLHQELNDIKAAGLFKHERTITTPQESCVGVNDGQQVINLCANNYLGLAQHPEINQSAKDALADWGFRLWAAH